MPASLRRPISILSDRVRQISRLSFLHHCPSLPVPNQMARFLNTPAESSQRLTKLALVATHARHSTLLATGQMAQNLNNVTDCDNVAWYWQPCIPVGQHYKATIRVHCYTEVGTHLVKISNPNHSHTISISLPPLAPSPTAASIHQSSECRLPYECMG